MYGFLCNLYCSGFTEFLENVNLCLLPYLGNFWTLFLQAILLLPHLLVFPFGDANYTHVRLLCTVWQVHDADGYSCF